MRKNSLIVSLVIIFTGLIIGGILMFNRQENESKQSYKREQNRIVEHISNNYKNINKVEFTSIEENLKTGYWNFEIIINDNLYVAFSEKGFGGEITHSVTHTELSRGNRLEKQNMELTKQNSNVEIVYFEEPKDD
ncbi:DUF1433 domain-containing protein [Streptococcus pluranimalium]|uniref:DUF1433 domain-containing protein n=2 Tax=Streptococcus pluranimalium TaxID=82348 RepID=A0A2L0D2L3_9STRE|nr:DUF1433 domain-containing protein [Streptococcus pluranimalium]AUW96072.1 DUF1433 domain-containing protein [Streptococcus pluranimalium]